MAGKLVNKPKDKSSRRQMNPAEFAEASALWKTGQHTLNEISQKLGFSKETLSRRFTKAGVIKGSSAGKIADEIEKEILSTSAQAAKVLSERVQETREEHYQWAHLAIKLSTQIMIEARKQNLPLASTIEEQKAIGLYMKNLEVAQKQRFTCLGLDKENYVDESELTELPITNLTAVEIDDIRGRAQELSLGVDDGLGGTLDDNEVVEEGFDED